MSLRLIGGWKFVGCYQTYSQTCMAAIRTLGRFTTFDGHSEAVIFHTRRNTEVLTITVYVGWHLKIRVVGAVEFGRLYPRGSMSCIYIH